MRRRAPRLPVLLLAALLLAAPACRSGAPRDPASDGVLRVVCVGYAAYDFARALTADAGEDVEVSLLGSMGRDMHGYEPSASDILAIGRADLLVSVGGVSEGWMPGALRSARNGSLIQVSMMRACGRQPTEDEHVWLSLTNAGLIVSALEQALSKADGARRPLWARNASAYRAELARLEDAYAAMRRAAVRDTIVVADRYPFAYLMEELDLHCLAAFPGCSSETSASFPSQAFLIERTRELGLPFVFAIEGSDGRVAEAVASAAGAGVLTLNSLQVVTDPHTTYLSAMRENLEALRRALDESGLAASDSRRKREHVPYLV